MVARAQHLYRFTVHYTDPSCLSRILDALFRAGAEPSWLFTRLSKRRCFRIDLRVADLPEVMVEALAARLRAMPFIQSVKFKTYVAPQRPSAVADREVLA